MRKLIAFLFFFSTALLGFSDNSHPEKINTKAIEKLDFLDKKIADLNKNRKLNEAIDYSKAAVILSKQTSNKYKLPLFYTHLASIYTSRGKLDSAFLYADSALKRSIITKDAKELSYSYRTFGVLYYTKGNLPKALSSFLSAQKNIEATTDSFAISKCLSNLGSIYKEIRNYQQSILYYNKALEFQKKMNDSIGMAKTLNNIGVYYDEDANEFRNDTLALQYFRKSLEISIAIKDSMAIALRRGNIGASLVDFGRYEEAEKELLSSVEIRKKMDDQTGLASSYLKLGFLYYHKKDYIRALEYAQLTEQINYASYEILSNANKLMYLISAAKGNYKAAYEYLQNYATFRDSLLNETKNKAIAELNARYEYDKKEKEIALLIQEKKISALELGRQSDRINRFRYGIIFSSLGVLFLGLSIFLLYSRYNNKKKLSQELERKNTQITRSINYAKRIQGALIPSKYLLVDSFSESFIFFKPKDIVSGDFYWISNQKDKTIIAVADCTGHGIPGAFLSMIGNTLLNEIVNQKAIYSPAAILTMLNDSIITTLGQTNVNLATQDDGMDISICCFYKKTKELVFAGANHSLTLFKDNQLLTIKGELFSIGGFSKNFAKVFTEHKITDLKKEDILYMFTDGYFDQFGGPNRKKFMSQRFKNLLQDIYTMPTDKQKNILEKTFAEWQGKEPQTDDILVVGLRV